MSIFSIVFLTLILLLWYIDDRDSFIFFVGAIVLLGAFGIGVLYIITTFIL